MKTTLKRTLSIAILIAIIGTFVYAQQQCVITGNVSPQIESRNQTNCWFNLTNHNSYAVNVDVVIVYRGEDVSNSQRFYLAAGEKTSRLIMSHWGNEKNGFNKDYLDLKIIVTKCE